MDMDNPPTQTQEEPEKMETDEKEEVVEDTEAKEKKPRKKGKKDEEPQFELLSNLSRVVPGQLKYISFPEGTRYAPVKKVVSLVETVVDGSLLVVF
jgi:26S proteasome regulatory subunit N2